MPDLAFHAALNAACIARERGAEWRRRVASLEPIAQVALWLAEIEAEPNFEWEAAAQDWETVCAAVARALDRQVRLDRKGWRKFLRKLIAG